MKNSYKPIHVCINQPSSGLLQSIHTAATPGPVNFLMFHHDIIPTVWHTDLPRYPSQLHTHPARTATNHTVHVTAADLTLILPHHVVAGHPIYPASVYTSLALPTTPAPAVFCISPLTMHVPLTGCPDDWLQAPKKLEHTRLSKLHAAQTMCTP